MWERPEWHTLDRIDNNLWYNPENCKRSNVYEQSRNKRNSNTIVGVSYDKSKNKYVSYISVGRYIILWRFAIYEEAVEARKNAEIEYCIYL